MGGVYHQIFAKVGDKLGVKVELIFWLCFLLRYSKRSVLGRFQRNLYLRGDSTFLGLFCRPTTDFSCILLRFRLFYCFEAGSF